MKPLFLSFTFVIIASTSFCQKQFWWANLLVKPSKEKQWVTQVNKAVGPNFVLLNENHSASYLYKEVDINKNGKKEVVVSVTDTITNKIKVFVFGVVAKQLKLIDTSAQFEEDFSVIANADSLVFNESYHRGHTTLIYVFNKTIGKYFFRNIGESTLEYFRNKSGLNGGWHFRKTYDVKTRKLTMESGIKDIYINHDYKWVWSKRKVIVKKIPKNFSLRLSNLKNPLVDYDYFSPLMDESKKFRKYFEYLY